MRIDLLSQTHSATVHHMREAPQIYTAESAPTACHYFVDEAGDATLFNHKGQVIVDHDGCSRFFILGMLKVVNPALLESDLKRLHTELIADSYFRRVPSMQVKEKKTAAFFHAHNDIPEVRWQVFQLLRKHNLQFHAAVRNKASTLAYVIQRNSQEPTYRYRPNDAYNDLTRRLFHGCLHKDTAYSIQFAQRGNSDQTRALKTALTEVQETCNSTFGITHSAELSVTAGHPLNFAGLQAVDYFLWALQRLYEKREERYVEYLASQIAIVRDLDDLRQKSRGEYYTRKRPLSLAALQELPGI